MRKQRAGGPSAQPAHRLWAIVVFSLADQLCLPWNVNLSLWGSLMKAVVFIIPLPPNVHGDKLWGMRRGPRRPIHSPS